MQQPPPASKTLSNSVINELFSRQRAHLSELGLRHILPVTRLLYKQFRS
jgi:hypothetical protein